MDAPLDYIFIDTCVLLQSHYFRKDGIVARLFDYSEQGVLNILMPEITKREWLKHYKDACLLKFDTADKKAALMGNTEEVSDFVKAYNEFVNKYNSFVSHMITICKANR